MYKSFLDASLQFCMWIGTNDGFLYQINVHANMHENGGLQFSAGKFMPVEKRLLACLFESIMVCRHEITEMDFILARFLL